VKGGLAGGGLLSASSQDFMVTGGSIYEDHNLEYHNERSSYGERCSSTLFSESGWSDSVLDSPRITADRTTLEEKEGVEPGCCDDLLSERPHGEPLRRRLSARLASGKLNRAQTTSVHPIITAPENPPQPSQDLRRRRLSGENFASGGSNGGVRRNSGGDFASNGSGGASPRPKLARRGSAPHVACRDKADEEVRAVNQGQSQKRRSSNTGLLSVSENQAVDEKLPTPSPGPDVDQKLGYEWMARLQACEESKQRSKDASRQILWRVDEAGLDITKLGSYEKIALQNKILHEIDGLLSYHLKQAFDNVSADEEELATLRKSMCETEERISNMNRTYLKEITTQRDKFRASDHVVGQAIGKVEENGNVEFYEPLQYLSEDMRSTVLAILDEKIKAIFAVDANLKDRTNAIELAKFEDAVRNDRLRSYEKMNSLLRDENREFRHKLQKTQSSLEKHEWELHQAKKKVSELEVALTEATQKPESNDVEVQCEDEAVEEEPPASPAKSVASCPASPASPAKSGRSPLAVSRQSGAVKAAAPRKELDRYDIGVQADMGGERRPSLIKRKSSFERFLMVEDTDLTLSASGSPSASSGDNLVQLNQARRQVDAAKKSLQQRDLSLRRLESELRTAQQRVEELETELRTQQDMQALQEAGPLTPCSSASKAEAEQSRRDIEQGAEKIKSLQEELETAQNETQVARHQARTLRADLEAARQENAKGEKRRLELVKGNLSEEASSELDEAIQNKNALFEELEQTKAAFSMVLSRNATLEMAVAALNPEGEQKKEESKAGKRQFSNNSHHSAAMDNDQVCNLVSQRGELREKVSIQKAQLSAIMQENTTLHLALQEMQQEVQHLTKQLRNAVPDIEVMNADLEAVLGRMDKVVRDGGGGYMRLHKEARLREIASETKAARRAEEATAEAAAASEAIRHSSASPKPRHAGEPRRGSGGGFALRNSKVEPLAPVSPPPAAQGPRRASATKTWASQTKDSPHGSKHIVQRAASTNVVAGKTEQRGSIALGSKGGMAILGGR